MIFSLICHRFVTDSSSIHHRFITEQPTPHGEGMSAMGSRGRGCTLEFWTTRVHVPRLVPSVLSTRTARVDRTVCLVSRSLVQTRATGTGGGADVLDRPRTTPGEPKTRRRRGRPSIYKVLLHNDDYNKREYVVQVLLKHVEGYTVRGWVQRRARAVET